MFKSARFSALFASLIAIAAIALSAKQSGGQARGPSSQRKGQFGFIHSMTPAAGGGFTLTVDYAEVVSGEAAERAAREDGDPSPKDPSGRYIENRTQSLRTLTMPPWAQVYLLQQMQPTLVKPAVLYSLLQGEKSSFGTFYGFPFRCEGENPACLPVRIIQRGGKVLRIEQEYLP
jgi:hypothetical protein